MNRRFIARWLLVALALHLLAAYFSLGYENSDEHFQILEFLNAYLGRTPWSQLPIEYVRWVRPWFQPFLYGLPVRALVATGHTNPFAWATAIRFLSAFIGWLSVVSLVACVPLWIKEVRWQRIAVIALALTWYLPALHARHASENLSGALFTLGLCLMLRLSPPGGGRARWMVPLAGGLLWGLAFESRYQVGIMVAGAFLWLMQMGHRKLGELSWIVLGIAVAVFFCTYLDFLGYGRWTFAPWNYFHFNLIEGYASSTDTSPWWDYFRRIWTETWPGLGFVMLAGMAVFWVLNPRHVLTWSSLPFFAVHVALAHKETRFLFPLAHLAPVCLVIALSQIKIRPKILSAVAWPLIGFNGFALLVFTFWPAAPTMRFYSAVYDRATAGELKELYYSVQDPYLIGGIPMYFYRPPGLILKPGEPAPPAGPFYYASPAGLKASDLERCVALQRSLPDFSRYSNFFRRFNNWTLYRCRRTS
jgi:phosphatidylinositol glycan class B